MKNTTKKKRKVNLDDLLQLNATNYNLLFSVKSFQRKYRTIFKFCIPTKTTFIITSKITGLSCMIDIEQNNYFTVKRSFHPHLYWFYCENQQELISKLIKRNLY